MHDEVLTKQATSLVPDLARFDDFYLAGGTALALQLGHRRSVDFDLFSSQSLPDHLLQKIKRQFASNKIEVTYRSTEQLNLIIDGVQVTFLSYPYPVIEPLASYQGLALVSVREIATMKAFAIGKRLAYKDYVDWYYLLKNNHVGLSAVITLAKEKFGGDFNDRLFLGQLVSWDDAPTQAIDFLNKAASREEIDSYLKTTV